MHAHPPPRTRTALITPTTLTAHNVLGEKPGAQKLRVSDVLLLFANSLKKPFTKVWLLFQLFTNIKRVSGLEPFRD